MYLLGTIICAWVTLNKYMGPPKRWHCLAVEPPIRTVPSQNKRLSVRSSPWFRFRQSSRPVYDPDLDQTKTHPGTMLFDPVP